MRFVKYLHSVLDHQITDDFLVEIFCRALKYNYKAVVNTITKGSFLDYTFAGITQRLERVAKTNHAWGIRDSAITKSSFSISDNPEQANMNIEVLQELVR